MIVWVIVTEHDCFGEYFTFVIFRSLSKKREKMYVTVFVQCTALFCIFKLFSIYLCCEQCLEMFN